MMKKLLACCLLGLMSAGSATVYAEQKPYIMGNDYRVHYFNYDENEVYHIQTRLGYSTLIQLDKGEVIHDDGGLGMGESKAWSVGVKGNNIFFKPVEFLPETNMIIVTNKRTYAFRLSVTDNDNVTYIARFMYPEKQDIRPQKNSSTSSVSQYPSFSVKEVAKDKFIDSRINTAYQKKGQSEIAPRYVWDNGLFTFLQFSNAHELPAIYKVMANGSEMIVNSHAENDVIVIHEVAKKLRLRLGSEVVDIRNTKEIKPEFNTLGTSIDGVQRVVLPQ